MNVLVTGAAGFIGRWVVERLLSDGHDVVGVDDLSNGDAQNVAAFAEHRGWRGLVRGDINDDGVMLPLFAKHNWDLILHLAASIHVQKSIDDPGPTFRNDALGTFRILELARAQYFRANGLDPQHRHFDFMREIPRMKARKPRVAVMSTCMVYDVARGEAISESHPYRPASPYAASKIAADMLAISYYNSYSLPVVVVRPFNTYGPFQRTDGEGGVVSIFLNRDLSGQPLLVKGDGKQTRDLLYVEDCADFVVRAALSPSAEGEIVNAGTGHDIAISELAKLCCSDSNRIEFVTHDHPQAEISKLLCDASKAQRLLDWKPKTSLAEGLARTRAWLATRQTRV